MSDEIALTPPAVPAWRRSLAQFLLGRGALGVPIVLGALLLLFPFISGDQYWIYQISLIAVYAMVVSGVNLSFGYAGEVQFGQVFMFALGAYIGAIFATHVWDEIIPLLLLGALAAVIAGALVAIPAVRFGGWALAIASFYLVVAIPDFVTMTTQYTGGLEGLAAFPAPKFFGAELGTHGLYLVAVISLMLWLACYRNLVTSRYGVVFRILRESPVQAASLGFSQVRLKVLAYTLGAAPAGIAGCVYAFLSQYLDPTTFGLTLAIAIVAASVLGGIESVYGTVIGAAILQLGPQSSASFQQYAAVVYGIFLIVAAVGFKQGLGGLGRSIAVRLSRALVAAPENVHALTLGSLVVDQSEDLAAEAHTAEVEAERTIEADSRLPEHEREELERRANAALEVHNISKAFGGVQALSDVSLRADPGRVTALIGSNGSGKTTLLNVICGYASADTGYVMLGGDRLTDLSPHRVARRGLGRTFQTPSIPRGVTVLDVVASGRFQRDGCGVFASIFRLPRYWQARRDDRREALVALERVELAHLASHEATQLSLGMRRLVEVARALCVDARLLLLDEPASGLSPQEIEILGRVIRRAADMGTTVVLVEHNFGFVVSVSDIVHVLHTGKLVASDSAEKIATQSVVIESYLGSSKLRGDRVRSRRATRARAEQAEEVAP